jgi:hypothetical protein
MNRFFLILTRIGMVFFAILSLMNSSSVGRFIFLVIALTVGFGGEFLYKKYRTKDEEKEDTAIELESKKKILKGVDNIANLKTNLESHAANKLQSLLSKANTVSTADKIRELDMLKREGVITEEEFSNAKKNLLGV